MVQRVAKINRKKKQAVKNIRYMCDVRMGINKKGEMNEKKKRKKKIEIEIKENIISTWTSSIFFEVKGMSKESFQNSC